ncbi:RagB/SusD family nutrient uptake outer membrane protein [Spirosoma areae]
MKTLKKTACTLLVATCLAACNPNLLETLPNDRISSEIYWQTDKDAELGANAIYPYLENVWDFVHWDAMSDIGHVTLTWRDESSIEKGAFDATLPRVSTEWNNAYRGIQAANTFLDNVGRVQTTNPELINRLKGEVRVLRAYLYIKLAFLFGDIPLPVKALSIEESRTLTKTPVAEVWNFIAKELGEAAAILPVTQSNKGRITKGAALALKARALLFAGRYSEAATAANEVIKSGAYTIYPSYEKLFSYEAENNQEVILDRQHIKDIQPNNIFLLTTPNSIFPQANSFVPTKQAVDAYQMKNGKDITDPASGFDAFKPYENRDPRLKYSMIVLGEKLPNNAVYDSRPSSGTPDAIGHSENATATGFNVKKYLNKEDIQQPSNAGINIILLRYAEVLLTYAESKIESNQLDQSVLDAINIVRQRGDVKMPSITSMGTQDEMRKIVRKERLVELAFEGLRYFDIRRWKVAENLVPGVIYGMTYADNNGVLKTVSQSGFTKVFTKNRDYLWPIPQRETELNRSITQNPNW